MAIKQALLLCVMLAATGAATAQTEIGEVYSGEASVRGLVLLSAQSTKVLSGSQVSAGDGAALLKLKRGGQLRVCPKTELSLSSDPTGKSLALGMNVGALELDYELASGADLLMTPDLRLQLISPGNFHLAVSVGASGDTCVRTLPGNDAAVFVAEMMGSDSYQLTPGRSVLFTGGKISAAGDAPPDCGCPQPASPPPQRPAQLTAAAPAPQEAVPEQPQPAPPAANPPAKAAAVPPPAPAPAAEASTDAAPPDADSAPQDKAQPEAAAHLEADSHFLFHGEQSEQDVYSSVSRLTLSNDNSGLALALVPHVILPPGATPPGAPAAQAVAQPGTAPAPKAAAAPRKEVAQAKPEPQEQGGGFLHRFFHKLFGH
jgi:hypothetical protein